jgi:hypothetical protein
MQALPIMMMMSVAGTTMSAVGKYQAGKTAEEVGEYNARVIEDKTQQEEAASRDRLRLLMGRQRALYAKAGVDLGSGSPLLVMTETAMRGEEEAQRIRASGQGEAALTRAGGESAYKSGTIGGISDFLGGVGSAAYQGYQMGMFKKPKVAIV